jgi:hypothetical protein
VSAADWYGSAPVVPPDNDVAVAAAIVAVVTAVTNPLALTVTTGIALALPYVPTLEFTVANVNGKLPDATVPDASPDAVSPKEMFTVFGPGTFVSTTPLLLVKLVSKY